MFGGNKKSSLADQWRVEERKGRMKKGLVLVAVLVLALSIGGFALENGPEGFRGLNWGDPRTEDMEFVDEIKGAKVYVRPADKLSLGKAKLDMILYYFWKSEFMRVSLHFIGKENYDLLETICLAKFGEETSQELFSIYWFNLQAGVSLNYDLIEEKGALSLDNWPLFKEYMETGKKKEVEEVEADW